MKSVNENPLRLGMIGGSLDSAVGTTHVLASQLDRKWKIASACFSHIPESNRRTAHHWGIDQEYLYDDWRLLIEGEKERIDAVALLTPTPMHAEMARAAIEAGIPVICEKALCTTASEARKLQEQCKASDAFLGVIYNYTGYPMLREIRHRIDAGQIGEVTQLHVEMPQEGYLKLDGADHEIIPQDWRLEDGEIPTLHLDLGVHLENLIYFLTGQRASEVVAVNHTHGHFTEVVDDTHCLARYTDGLHANLWFGKSALGYSNGLRVRVFGSLGTMEWLQMDPERVVFHDNHGSSRIIDPRSSDLAIAAASRYNRFKPGHPNGFIEAFANYYWDLADAVRSHLAGSRHQNFWVFDVDDAVAGMNMLDAMQTSAISGTWVPVCRD